MQTKLMIISGVILACTAANAQEKPTIGTYIDHLQKNYAKQLQYELRLQVPLLAIDPKDGDVEIVYPETADKTPGFTPEACGTQGKPICHQKKKGNFHIEKYCSAGTQGKLQVDLWFLTTARVDTEIIDCPVPPPGTCAQYC